MAWATELAVGNVALSLLGEGTITDIDSTTDARALALSAFFDTARDHVLSLHDWAFADTLVQLTENTTSDNFSIYDTLYARPTDMIRLVTLTAGTSDYSDSPYDPFVLRGAYLATDNDPCWIRYTKQITTVSLWPHWFGLAMAHYLAYLASPRITENPKKTAACFQTFGQQLIEAIRMDAVQRKERTIPPTLITDIG